VNDNWQGMPGPLGKVHVLFGRGGSAEIRPTETGGFEATVYIGAYRTQRPVTRTLGDDLAKLMVWCEFGLSKVVSA
jgi:hypothetical protein